MERTLRPELLDSLPPNDPAALHNRRDLRLINRFMGTEAWMAKELSRRLRPAERVLEIGAGTGELVRGLARRGILIDGLDLWPQPESWPKNARWHRADLRTFTGYADYAVIVGSLIFHQFTEEELGALGRKIAHARAIIASEPRRARRAQVLLAVGGALLGANHVTRHDARVSVEAGFVGNELARHLKLESARWRWESPPSRVGIYRFAADRVDAND